LYGHETVFYESIMDFRDRGSSDPVFDRFPPDVKREFLVKNCRDETQAAEFAADIKKIRIIGAVIGGVVGFGLGLLVGLISIVLAVSLCLTSAGAGYLIVDRRLGQLASMALFTGPVIVLPFVTGEAKFSVIGFVFLLMWMGACSLYRRVSGLLGEDARDAPPRTVGLEQGAYCGRNAFGVKAERGELVAAGSVLYEAVRNPEAAQLA
jgi:hypothetical protein